VEKCRANSGDHLVGLWRIIGKSTGYHGFNHLIYQIRCFLCIFCSSNQVCECYLSNVESCQGTMRGDNDKKSRFIAWSAMVIGKRMKRMELNLDMTTRGQTRMASDKLFEIVCSCLFINLEEKNNDSRTTETAHDSKPINVIQRQLNVPTKWTTSWSMSWFIRV
jgi:hypothetical protein